jgi:hypothetical protein
MNEAVSTLAALAAGCDGSGDAECGGSGAELPVASIPPASTPSSPASTTAAAASASGRQFSKLAHMAPDRGSPWSLIATHCSGWPHKSRPHSRTAAAS